MTTLAVDVLALPALTNTALNAALSKLVDAGTNPNFGPLESIVRTMFQYDQDYYSGALPGAPDALNIVNPAGNFAAYDVTGITTQAAASTIYNSAGLPGNNANNKAKNASGPLRVLFEKLYGLVYGLYEAACEEVINREKELNDSNAVYANIDV